MATTIFRSTDASAPVLHGNAGSLISVLDACLVNGYGSLSALGWAKPFSGTNLAVYRAASGARQYLDVNDNAPNGTALGQNAQVRGYEAMTAAATGTNPFPTTTQVTTCVGICKSTATGTTARPWLLIGDAKSFYLFVESGGTDPPNLLSHTWTSAFFFGEIFSALSGDLYRTILAYQSTTATVATAGLTAFNSSASTGTSVANMNMPRTYTGSGSSLWAQGLPNWMSSGPLLDSAQTSFPNPVDGGIYLSAVDIAERGSGTTAVAAACTGAKGIRGRLRGLYTTISNGTGFNDQDTFTGVGDFAGLSFVILKTTSGAVVFDTGTWAASS